MQNPVDRLCAVLVDELAAISHLNETLVRQRRLLDAGRTEVLGAAGRAVEDALADLRDYDLLRAVTANTVHAVLSAEGRPATGDGQLTVWSLAERAEPSGRRMLTDLAEALTAALDRVTLLAFANAQRLEHSAAVLRAEATTAVGASIGSGVAVLDAPPPPVGIPAAPTRDDVCWGEAEATMDRALSELELQAINCDAAAGLLRNVDCRPLADFLAR